MKNRKGFTLLELMIVYVILMSIIVVVDYYLIGGILIKGNYWVSEKTALKAIQIDNPDYIKIVKLNRNVKAYSVAIAEDKNGDRKSFALNTNILQNIDVIEPVEPEAP